jgi:hypothetical protein
MQRRNNHLWKYLVVPLLLGAIAMSGALPAAARADFGVHTFDGQVSTSSGAAYTQAAGHPFAASTTIVFNAHPDPEYGIFQIPDGDPRDLYVDLPPGLVGNPTAPAKCSQAEFFAGEGLTECLPAAQVGVATLTATLRPSPAVIPVYSLTPPPGVPATFGFIYAGVPVMLNARLRSDTDYGLSIDSEGINQGMQLTSVSVELWGTPADPVHDEQRCRGISESTFTCSGAPGDRDRTPNPAGVSPQAFVTNPSACTANGVGLKTVLRTDSWQAPGVFQQAGFVSHDPPGQPLPPSEWGPEQGPSGCEQVPFSPRVDLEPTSSEAGSPTGLEFEITVPTGGLVNPSGVAQSALKKTEMTLPVGMVVNPATANGLGACAPGQFAEETAGSGSQAGCPSDSKIGSVTIDTLLLEEPLQGSVYVARQGENPFGSLLALYLVAKNPERGIIIKLSGKVDLDPQSGRLRVLFDDNPQLPFTSLRVRINAGPTAPLVNPPACGTYSAQVDLTPWARPDTPVSLGDSFRITGSCPTTGQFAPGFEAGTANPVGGAYSPFTLRVTRSDGQQNLQTVGVTLPEGLLAKLAGVPLCSDTQAATGNCPAESQVGETTVRAGAGPNPISIPQPGKEPTAVYLAGPYDGAPYSLVVKVPAQAGPFDLGTVAVRNTINVDPTTTQVSVKSDPLPQILEGIPISYRDIRVDVNRGGFMLNPTSCDPTEVEGTIGSSAGIGLNISSRFQVGNCEALGFTPKLALRLSGAPPRRGANPALKATLTPAAGQANIGAARVILPATELLEQAHIKTVCTRVQFAANQCPAGSVYGYAKAWTPLLDTPLEGPVYLRSNGGERKLPDLVADLNGSIHVVLVGYIDSVKRHGSPRIRTRFLEVPDAPVSRFVLEMQKGKKSLLANNTNLCKAKPRAEVSLSGQNAKDSEARPLVKVSGCGGKSKAHKQSKSHKK